MLGKKRWRFIGLLLALSIAAALYVAETEHGTVAAAEPLAEPAKVEQPQLEQAKPQGDEAPKAQAPSDPRALPLEKLKRTAMEVGEVNPFQAKSWYVPPPPPPPAPPPKPTAPPMPFQYMGKLEKAGSEFVVYLAKGNLSFAVTVGEKFDNDYRLEAVENGALVIMYLPLSLKQTLPMGTN